MTFEDSPYPVWPGYEMPKPKAGDTLILRDMPSINIDQPKEVVVHAVFDSLAEDWGVLGESAWAQHETNEQVEHKGHWYAVVFDPKYDGETWSVASYEVEEVISSMSDEEAVQLLELLFKYVTEYESCTDMKISEMAEDIEMSVESDLTDRAASLVREIKNNLTAA